MSKEEYGRIMSEIETLPGGGITYKKINGREYAYYQWREAGSIPEGQKVRNWRC